MATANEAATKLSAELVEFLQGPQLVLVTTLDETSKWPTNNLITWVVAKGATSVRLAADAKGRIMNNIRADERVLLTFIAHGACHTVEGRGRVIAENLEGVALKLGCAEVAVQAVRDVTFWGGTITVQPEFAVTYEQDLKERLDTGVFAAMRGL